MKKYTEAEINCINALRAALLPAPVECEPFTISFDVDKLLAAQDLFENDLYKKCLNIVMEEAANNEK